MSSSIWMECAGESEIRALELEPWRVVEAQHQVSTRKLVDSDEEQLLLEQLIETAKPAKRTHGALHYLLFTPFRYPPLRYGSRFGTRAEPGIWYGSETLHTAFAEVAYYRVLFLEGTSAELGLVETSLTSFTAVLRAERGIDLTAAPFCTHENRLAAPDSYSDTQSIGSAMREAGVEAARFRSARDMERGVNVAVFSASAFGRRQPRRLQTWHCVATRWAVQISRRDYFERGVHSFERAQFLVDGRLPAPGLT